MHRNLLLLTLSVLTASCGSEATLPTPEGESAQVIVAYPSGGVDTVGVTGVWVHPDTLVEGNDTTYCLSFYAEGPGIAQGEGEDPVVDLLRLTGCGQSYDTPPAHWTRPFGELDISSTARASSVAYDADSGSGTVTRLGGGFAEVKLGGRYTPSGGDGSPRFRISAKVVVVWQEDGAE